MGWWPFGRGQDKLNDNADKIPQNVSLSPSDTKTFLEDLPPKFQETEANDKLRKESQIATQMQQKSTFKSAFETISANDFAFGNLVRIPCFRDAGLIGLSAMGVFSVTILLFTKKPATAANWGVGAGLLGSTVGWEQCRTRRKRSFENVEKAKATMRAKPRPMLHKKSEADEDNKN